MTEAPDVERAERVSRSRARMFAVQGIIFIVWQAMFFAGRADNPMRNVDTFKISAWLVWVVALLLALATDGALLRGRGTMFENVTGREAVHVILSAGIGAALLTFAARGRRTADSS